MAEVRIELRGYQCERCEHKWVPRNKRDTPVLCPKCKSAYWDRPRKNKKKYK